VGHLVVLGNGVVEVAVEVEVGAEMFGREAG